MSRYTAYEAGKRPLPKTHLAWPLYGAGLGNLGQNGMPVERPLPSTAPDEMLMRIDACSLCYTDLKQIGLGSSHPRLLGRDLAKDPVVPGHEVSLTVVAVGKELAEKYQIGQRFTLQPDIWLDGKSVPFCFGMDGGYRQFTRIGKEILDADAGNHLVPIPDALPYAGSALVEPWACVEATYRIQYRSNLQNGGRMLIMGQNSRENLTTGSLISPDRKPSEIFVVNLPSGLLQEIRQICRAEGITLREKNWQEVLASDVQFDDVLLLEDAITSLKEVNPLLAKNAVVALCQSLHSNRTADVDLGRIHYDAVQYIGTDSTDLSEAYTFLPLRSEMKPKGRAFILGAGGPMGRMNLQRAIQDPDGPGSIFASERNLQRYKQLDPTFTHMAENEGVDLTILNPRSEANLHEKEMQRFLSMGGFDDIRLMVVSPKLVEEMVKFSANRGVVDIFAGLKRGTTAAIQADIITGLSHIGLIGHSGLTHADEQIVLNKFSNRTLSLEHSVAAVGGMMQIPEGIEALGDSRFPGKIVIYPHIRSFPLTALPDLQEIAPDVYAALGKGETWTRQAEIVFLESYLDD